MTYAELIACHECDLLQHRVPLPPSGVARCRRCGATLYRSHPESLDHALAFTLSAVVLFMIANAFPIVGLAIKGELIETTLLGAVHALYSQDMWFLAGLVFTTAILMPLVELAAMAYLLVPLQFKRVPYRPALVFRALHLAEPWGMVEVFMLGILVALSKLSHIASVVPGIALWSFGVLMLLTTAAVGAFDPRDLWAKMEGGR